MNEHYKEIYTSLEQAVEVARQSVGSGLDMQVTETNIYLDVAQKAHMAVIRLDPVAGPGTKIYLTFHAVESGWCEGAPQGAFPLFGLQILQNCDSTVLVLEGEKCTGAGYKLDICCTTSAHGPGSAAKSDWSPLAGREVAILPDNDEAGRLYAEEVARIVSNLSPPATVRIIDPSTLYCVGKDLYDCIADRINNSSASNAEVFSEIRAEVVAAAADADEWNRDDEEENERQEEEEEEEQQAEILDRAPDTICRPLCFASGHAYLVTHIYARNGSGASEYRVVLRGDGMIITDLNLKGAVSPDELGISVELPQIPKREKLLSGPGLTSFMAGEIPHPADVLQKVYRVVDHFTDFECCFGSQQDMCNLVSLYIIATYFLGAFDVIGYLWPNGDKGCGKTKLISIVTSLGYLGELIIAGSSYASMRDLAANGAVLGMDDSENIMKKNANSETRELILAGNRRGATITVKERGCSGWKTKHSDIYCPKVFSAINQPDDVLGSRTIVIPMIRSADNTKANLDPVDLGSWPEGADRSKIIDALWLTGLTHMPVLRDYYRRVPEKVQANGRELEPWRGILAIALWLDECYGITGLFDTIVSLMESYKNERSNFVEDSVTVVFIKALSRIRSVGVNLKQTRGADILKFMPGDVADVMCAIASEEDISSEGDRYVTVQKVGCVFRQQRFTRSTRKSAGRVWTTSVSRLEHLARAYGATPAETDR